MMHPYLSANLPRPCRSFLGSSSSPKRQRDLLLGYVSAKKNLRTSKKSRSVWLGTAKSRCTGWQKARCHHWLHQKWCFTASAATLGVLNKVFGVLQGLLCLLNVCVWTVPLRGQPWLTNPLARFGQLASNEMGVLVPFRWRPRLSAQTLPTKALGPFLSRATSTNTLEAPK